MRVLVLLALAFALTPFLQAKLARPQVHGEFWPNGTLKAQHTMRRAANGELVAHGPFRGFHDNGNSESVGHFENGLQTGEWLWYDREGKLIGRCDYHRGEGNFRGFFSDGRIQTEGKMRGTQRDGLWTEWYASGPRRMRGKFVDGRQHGLWTYWSELDSTQSRTVIWEHGRALNR